MLKAVESELYRISKSNDHEEDVYIIEIIETSNTITVFKDELDELIMLLNKVKDIL